MKKYIYLLLITLLISNTVMLFMLIKKPHRPHSPNNFLIEKLDFNQDQKGKIMKFNESHHKLMRGYDDKIIVLRKQIFDTVLQQNSFDSNITSQIGELEAKKEQELYSFLLQIKKICNEEQIIELNKIFKHIINKPSQDPPHKR